MSKSSKSEFMEWFRSQHGPRELDRPISSMSKYTDDELHAAASRGRAADAELARRALWDARKEAALSAWAARRLHVA